jgi:cytoskeleton protein RodZ
MKTVGKQLQEARLAKNWTPELAARETKIKVDRLHDLETDDYSHFTSPTYARGFVRTYARALGLDEYRILRQLDNKLPDDDSANIVTDTGVAYLPETAMPPRAAHRDYTGLYIVMGLGVVVSLAILVVLFEAYRVGELSHWFGSNSESVAADTTSSTNTTDSPAVPTANSPARALPVDSNTPPPIVDAANAMPVASAAGDTNAVTTPADTNAPAAAISPRALPVDPSLLAAGTNAAPDPSAPVQAVRALPVDPSELNNAPPAASNVPVAPRALPVNPSDLGTPVSDPTPATVAMNTPASGQSTTEHASNSSPVMEPSMPPVAPVTPDATTPAATGTDKRLVLTASQDSFVSVTNLDSSDTDKPVYAAVLHSGQSIGFDGKKFSINVGIPSAVDIKLDGVNYGPHSDQAAPETFTVQSHLP